MNKKEDGEGTKTSLGRHKHAHALMQARNSEPVLEVLREVPYCTMNQIAGACEAVVITELPGRLPGGRSKSN